MRNRTMEERCFILIGLCLAATIHAQCPTHCTCSTNQVACTGGNFTTIPRIIPHSTTTLDLSDNRIHHVTYAAMTSLRNMVNLSFKQNVITSIDDGALQTMDSLQTLDLSHNQLNSVTEQVFLGIAKLMHLDLSFNNLRLIDGSFTGMTELARLDLRSNQIERISQFSFRDLTSLRHLFLANNQISHIDRRAFRHLEKLMYLVLKGNPLHHIPRFEFHSQHLSYMDLSECQLADVPRGLPSSIRYLQLRRNNITRIEKRSLRECPYVTILVLDENRISEIELDSFETMSYLQQLWLNGNELSFVPQRLPVTLQRLLMDQNHVTSISQSFPADSKLHTLSFMGNDISHVDFNSFGSLLSLASLDLSNNHIQHIYGNMFQNNTELETLLLSKNPLEKFHSHAFWGLTRLKQLSLAYVESYVNIHPDAFSDLKLLQKLAVDSSPHLVHTLLHSPHFLAQLESVEELSMENSELSTLSDDFPTYFPHLATLHLSSSSWYCDSRLAWLRDWLLSTAVALVTEEEVTCYSPRDLHGRALVSIEDHEFATVTSTVHPPTTREPAIFTTFPTIPSTMKTTQISTTKHRKVAPTGKGGSAETDQYDYAEGSSGYADGSHNGDDTSPEKSNPQDSFGEFYQYYINGENQDPNERRHVSAEDYFNRSPLYPFWDITTKFPNPVYNHNGYDSTVDPLKDPSLQQSQDPGGGALSDFSNITIIVIIVTLVTAVCASIIIALIIYFVRKQRTVKHQKEAEPPPAYQNGIPLKHNNDVLYFMPNGMTASHHSTVGDTAESKSQTDSVRTSSSGRSKGSSGRNKEHVTLLPTGSGRNKSTKEHVAKAKSKEQASLLPGRDITLIPGRDINHEGPMRVYKWEDF